MLSAIVRESGCNYPYVGYVDVPLRSCTARAVDVHMHVNVDVHVDVHVDVQGVADEHLHVHVDPHNSYT